MSTNRIVQVLIAAVVLSATSCSRNTSASTAGSDNKPAAESVNPDVAQTAAAPNVTIPSGTRLQVALLTGVSSDKSRPGDPFIATLVEPIAVDGKTVLPKGTKVRGRVADAKRSGRVKGRASIRLMLTDIELDNGKSVSISTKPYTQVARATKGRDAAIIAGGAGIGTAIGAIAGGAKGALIGAAVGGGAGTGTVLVTRGKEIHLTPETRLRFTLAGSVEI
jgi:hypothetical protein